jgi:hypothetical protein
VSLKVTVITVIKDRGSRNRCVKKSGLSLGSQVQILYSTSICQVSIYDHVNLYPKGEILKVNHHPNRLIPSYYRSTSEQAKSFKKSRQVAILPLLYNLPKDQSQQQEYKGSGQNYQKDKSLHLTGRQNITILSSPL